MKRRVVISGIYKITNLINGKFYIGSSVDILNSRFSYHKSYLKRGAHDNDYLQKSWNKHGKENFKFEIVEIVYKQWLLEDREQYWLDKYWDDGQQCYNLSKCADAPMRGRRVSEDTKKKLSKRMKDKYINGFINPCRGRTHTDDAKRKISKANKGKIISEAQKLKISEAHKNIPRSEEVKQKISKANTGKHVSSATKNKMSEAHIGLKSSEATKSKISESQLKIHEETYNRLTWEDVDKIRELYKSGHLRQKDIGNMFRISESQVSKIINNKRWTDPSYEADNV